MNAPLTVRTGCGAWHEVSTEASTDTGIATLCGRMFPSSSRVVAGDVGCADCLRTSRVASGPNVEPKRDEWDAQLQRMLQAPRPVMPRPFARRSATSVGRLPLAKPGRPVSRAAGFRLCIAPPAISLGRIDAALNKILGEVVHGESYRCDKAVLSSILLTSSRRRSDRSS